MKCPNCGNNDLYYVGSKIYACLKCYTLIDKNKKVEKPKVLVKKRSE